MRQKGDRVEGLFYGLDGSFHGDFAGKIEGDACAGSWRFLKAPEQAPKGREFRMTLSPDGREFTDRRYSGIERGTLLDRLPKVEAGQDEQEGSFSGVWWSAYDVSIMIQSGGLIEGVGWTHDGSVRIELRGKVEGDRATGEWVHGFKDGRSEKGEFEAVRRMKNAMLGVSRNSATGKEHNFSAVRIAFFETIVRESSALPRALTRKMEWHEWTMSLTMPADWREGESNATRRIYFKIDNGRK